MKPRVLIPVLILLAALPWLSGCIGHRHGGHRATFTDLGVVDATSGVPIRRLLADGRECIIVPSFINHTTVEIHFTANSRHANGLPYTYTLVTTLAADQKSLLTIDHNSTISLTLHESE